jgi:hypothetical protein
MEYMADIGVLEDKRGMLRRYGADRMEQAWDKPVHKPWNSGDLPAASCGQR